MEPKDITHSIVFIMFLVAVGGCSIGMLFGANIDMALAQVEPCVWPRC